MLFTSLTILLVNGWRDNLLGIIDYINYTERVNIESVPRALLVFLARKHQFFILYEENEYGMLRLQEIIYWADSNFNFLNFVVARDKKCFFKYDLSTK